MPQLVSKSSEDVKESPERSYLEELSEANPEDGIF